MSDSDSHFLLRVYNFAKKMNCWVYVTSNFGHYVLLRASLYQWYSNMIKENPADEGLWTLNYTSPNTSVELIRDPTRDREWLDVTGNNTIQKHTHSLHIHTHTPEATFGSRQSDPVMNLEQGRRLYECTMLFSFHECTTCQLGMHDVLRMNEVRVHLTNLYILKYP